MSGRPTGVVYFPQSPDMPSGGFDAAIVFDMALATAIIVRCNVFARRQIAVFFAFSAHNYPPKMQSISPYITLAVMP